ncbi:MAG: hypothetical protein HQM09_24685 [Candidatus Riflebacteria bacterium]|nr:hypothetical protein [Candidatus Riflebacteria bacterium]
MITTDPPKDQLSELRLIDPPGFRFWWTDALVLAVVVILTSVIWPIIGEWALLAPMVVGHFFLFCNVFRVGTRRELAWMATFILNFLILGSVDWLSPGWLLAVQAPVTLIVIGLAVKDPCYHGLRCRWLSLRGR